MKYLNIWLQSYRIIKGDYKKFETDPVVQFEYHKKMIKFWMLNFLPMNIIVAIAIWASVSHHVALGVLMSAILLGINTNYSLYANWDTEVGDAHGAYASMRADEIQAKQSQPERTSEF